MFILYNLTQIVLLPVIVAPAVLYILLRPKYRKRILFRLGVGLKSKVPGTDRQGPTFWLHALSVGEITSAIPLLRGIEKRWPESTIVVSVATQAGHSVASSLLQHTRALLIDGPMDAFPVVSYFIRSIRPDYFIMVETDFWPNLLYGLKRKGIHSILVNGRISRKSMSRYCKFRFFFRQMFNLFDQLCLQTQTDQKNLEQLGILPEKLHTLGNLKFDTLQVATGKKNKDLLALLPAEGPVLIAGSTHRGEESLIIPVYCRLRLKHPNLQLILAPRQPQRAPEIQILAEQAGLQVILRSNKRLQFGDIFLLDTLGELNTFYALADIAVVGGSIVAAGGHNPIEPASLGIPVLFGPHMEDFEEISALLLQRGGAVEFFDEVNLYTQLDRLLSNPDQRIAMGTAAMNTIGMHQGVVASHLDLLQRL